jgi:hypothetical protein
MRKLFFSSLALFLLVIIFLLAYNFAFKNNANDAKVTPPSEDTEKSGAEEGFGKEKPVSVATAVTNPINENILGAVTGPDDSLFYYSQDDRSFKKASLEGKNKTVLLSNLPGKPLRVVWSPKRDTALVLIEGLPTNRWHTATFSTKSLVPLKQEIVRVTWNGLGDKIYYLFKNSSGDFSLNRSNPDGSDWKEVTKLSSQDVFLGGIPQSNRISFWNRPNGLEESILDAIDIDGANRKKLFGGRYGGDYLWSPNGERVVVSASLSKGGPLTLALMNKNGGELQSLNIPTLISKVVWSKDGSKLFYALPGGLDQALLPNDYFEKNLSSQDTFWQVDLGTGKSSRLLELTDIGQSFDSIDLSLSASEDVLFFTDRSTQRIYRIDL